MLILSNQYKLGNEGCEKLSKGNWGPKLSQLNLGTSSLLKFITTSPISELKSWIN